MSSFTRVDCLGTRGPIFGSEEVSDKVDVATVGTLSNRVIFQENVLPNESGVCWACRSRFALLASGLGDTEPDFSGTSGAIRFWPDREGTVKQLDR
jgi:hypothetical protein